MYIILYIHHWLNNYFINSNIVIISDIKKVAEKMYKPKYTAYHT